jgi:hypothetical protein
LFWSKERWRRLPCQVLRKLRRMGLAKRSKCEAEGVASHDGALSPLRNAVSKSPNGI